MTQISGGISVDEGYRTAIAGTGSSRNTSPAEQRAAQASPGAWDEDLGKWGAKEWNLPGQGESGHRCGEWYPAAVCDECAEVDMVTHSCGNRSCPNCWGVWAQKAGIRATVRIQAFRYTEPDNYKRQTAHAVVSPPEGEVMNERQYFDGKTKAAEIAKEKGFRGFAVIPHPYRVTDEGKQRYREADPECGIWVWLRKEVENMERFISWSPHYHIIGLTSRDMEEAKEEDEWSYTFIRTFERFDGVRDEESHNDLYGGFRYLLSHTGYPEGSTKQVVTWYGELANSVFVEEASEEWQHEKPSEGIMSGLTREVEAVAGATVEEEGEGGGRSDEEEDREVCPVEECGGELIDVFDVGAYLRQRQPPPEVEETMIAARDWRLGRRQPPPGMQRPQTEEQAREALETLR